MRKTILYIVLIITAGFTSAQAQVAPTPLSLQDCMDYAMQHNYAMKNARLNVKIQAAQNNEVTANAYPKINGKAEFDDYLNPQKTFLPAEFFPNGVAGTFVPITFTPQYGATAAVSGLQILFDGSVLVALQARNAVMDLARQGSNITAENVKYGVKKAYYSLVIAYRQFNIVKQALAFSRSIDHDLAITYQNGFAEKIDVERSNVQVINQETDSLRISNLLTISEQMLKYQIGMNISQPIVLTDTNIESNINYAIALAHETVDYYRLPEFQLYNTTLKLNEYNVRRYKLSALPSLNAFGSLGYNYSSNDFDQMWKWRQNYLFNSVIGLQLNMPIFNGLMRVNQLREARLNVEKSQNSIDSAKLSIDFQSSQSRSQLKTSIQSMNAQNKNMQLAGDVLYLAQKKYKAGVGSNLEVSTAQQDLLRAQNSYFSALQDVINAETDLQKLLGYFNNDK